MKLYIEEIMPFIFSKYIYIYIYIYYKIDVYVYIYIERERQIDRQIDENSKNLQLKVSCFQLM